jgi:uncharacterized SAM-dependent methyltransferase
VLEGLAARPKHLLSKHLYDAEGSALFDRITELDEYYPTRTEVGILREKAGRLREELPAGTVLLEPGAGSGVKTRILLDALPACRRPMCPWTFPASTSRRRSAKSLGDAYPDVADPSRS